MSANNEKVYGTKTYYPTDKKYTGTTFITVYKNQRVLQLHKKGAGIDFAAHSEARVNLTSSAFLLYDYLVCHSDGWIWPISAELVNEKTNLGRTTYLHCIRELMLEGYIIPGKIDTGEVIIEENAWHIFEHPVQLPQQD